MFFTPVARVSEINRLASAPTNPMFLAYFSALDSTAAAFSPFKNIARAQAEIIGFMSRRVRACLEAPSQLTACRNPHDVLHEQMRFWDQAAQEYTETSRRIFEAWAPAMMLTQSAPDAVTPSPQRVHDYIEFPVARRSRRAAETFAAQTAGFA